MLVGAMDTDPSSGWPTAALKRGWTKLPNCCIVCSRAIGLSAVEHLMLVHILSSDEPVAVTETQLGESCLASQRGARQIAGRLEERGLLEIRPSFGTTAHNAYTAEGYAFAVDLVARNIAAGHDPDEGLDACLHDLSLRGAAARSARLGHAARKA